MIPRILCSSSSGSKGTSLESLIHTKRLPDDTPQTASPGQQGWVWVMATELPKTQGGHNAATDFLTPPIVLINAKF